MSAWDYICRWYNTEIYGIAFISFCTLKLKKGGIKWITVGKQ